MKRRKFVIGLGALGAGGAAAMGTGAFTSAAMGRNADINVVTDGDGLLALTSGHEYTSGEGSVSEHYVGMEGGELKIDLTGGDEVDGKGINPDSTYQFGAIGERGGEAIDKFVNHADDAYDPPRVTSDDVEHGAAAGGSKTTVDDPAFVVTNQTTVERDVELFFDGEGVDGATTLLVGANGSYGATTFKIDPANDDDAGRMGAFPLAAGDSLYISILVVTNGNVEPEDSYDGDLLIQAGEAEGSYE